MTAPPPTGLATSPRAAEVQAALAAIVGHDCVHRDMPLARHTTFRIGGKADWLVDAWREEDLVDVLAVVRRFALPLTMLGGGSNVLVADDGVRGVVVRTRHAAVSEVTPGVIRASAGVSVNRLVRWTIHRGLSGLEAWAGTPGTVGGAIHGNAHFRGQPIGGLVTDVGLIPRSGVDQPGDVVRTPGAAMEFSYDRSRVQRTGELVAWAEFAVSPAPPDRLRAIARESLRFRKRTQPLAQPSAGCIFQNPDVVAEGLEAGQTPYAGALIDGAGLKGCAVGGARVSETHANFIVTEPGAMAVDVRGLIHRVQRAVRERYGVTLRPEVVFLGEFEADWRETA
ncbi:MAG: UDP-N-acetylmuramate dehydrogenase [Acidobacteria bacterium]|nr:UDP-N-acetylmuramate dehydrogenase [Acidobacteriota bacterium]